jgi:hypothetical protein
MTAAYKTRGQSMVEFLVAMAVLLPLFLAVNYLGRYGDLQQRATQASRYAAMQRAMQPNTALLSNTTIEDQMRARFFLAPTALAADGHLRSDDSVVTIKDATGQPALWTDLGGKAMLASPAQATLTWASTSFGSGKIDAAANTLTGVFGKAYTGNQQAMVELNLFNRLDLSVDKPKNMMIGATTAAAGNGLGSSGSADTRDSAARIVPSTLVPKAVEAVLSAMMFLFETDSPELGCIKPDVVATHRLDGGANNSQCK